MVPLSSKATFLYKRLFPVFWFGILILFVAVPLLGGRSIGQDLPVLFFIIPVAMIFFGYALMKKLIFDLVDEVFDLGDALLIRNGNQEDRVALSDIMNINYTPLVSPPRVTLSLRRPSVFGTQVTFCAPLRFVPFSTSPVIDQLIVRVDAARRAK